MKMLSMFDKVKQCKLSHKMMIRLNKFLYIFNLRQGTILIAVHQIALASFVLIILLVGIVHVGDMLSMLHNDMEDDAERHFYDVADDQMTSHEGDVTSTNNQRRFAKAQHLASVTVIFLYTTTILTAIYLMCCVSLLYGAVRYRREFVVPWILAACFGGVLVIAVMSYGDGYPCIVNLFGGHKLYYVGCGLFVFTLVYAIMGVSSFALEMGNGRCARALQADERGERLLLLDHAAHSSLLSAAQINKLSQGTRTQFV